MVLAIGMVVAIAISLLLHVVGVRLGAKWARNERTAWKWCFLAVGIMVVPSVIANVVADRLADVLHPIAVLIFAVVLMFLPIVAGIRYALKPATVKQGILIALPVIGIEILLVILALAVVRPFVAEAFVTPAMGMAPTVRGPHVTGKCPQCGAEALVNAPTEFDPGTMFICTKCLAAGENRSIAPPGGTVHSADRFMVNKLRSPQRFDVVAYRVANQRSNAIWLKRIVGMPGETVVLDEGALFIDGAKMTPPQWVPPIHFGQFPNGLRSKSGSASQPCTLGPGEYFAIGDNQMFSLDSRMEGPVRKESIVGVAELIYWPLSRVRTFR